jgi:adenylate cyclase
MKEQRKLAAIMFTDIVGYTALMSRDEQHAHQIMHKSRDILKTLIGQYNGELLRTLGDGTLSSFASVVDAVNCALEIQRTIRDEPELSLRIGIHIGDVVFEEGEVYGDGVNVASRLEPLAEPGGICISGQVYRNVRNRPGIEAVFLGEKILKNVDLPMKVYALTVEPPTAVPEPSVDKETQPAPVRKHNSRILIASALIVVAVLGLYAIYSRYFAVPTIAPVAEKITSIAVMPFVNMSADKEQEYFCDGLAEELLNMLAKVNELRVTARTSSFSFKGQSVDIATIGEKLNVESVLEGSVRKSGDKVRITAQLIKVSDGYHIWSVTYDRTLDDIFVVQEEISRQVVDALKVTLLGEDEIELVRRPTENIEAYELYLLGRHNLVEWDIESVERAIAFFSQAIELDPEYALAWAGLADAHIRQRRATNVSMAQATALAEEAAVRALALDSLLAEAHAAFGWVKDWQKDFPAAEAAFKKAIELNPNYIQSYRRYGHLLYSFGRWKDAQAFLEQALEIDPLSQDLKDSFNYTLLMMGRFEETESKLPEMYRIYGRLDQALKRTLERVEADPANSARHSQLYNVYLTLGEYEMAEKSLTRARELAPERFSKYYNPINNFLLARGQYDRMAELYREWQRKFPDRNTPIVLEAILELTAGNPAKALLILERADLSEIGSVPAEIFLGATPYSVAVEAWAPMVFIANIYLSNGNQAKAEKLLTRCRSDMKRLRDQGLATPPSYYVEATLHAVEGESEQALADMRQAIDLGWRQSWYARSDPNLESLRNTPEFKEMMAEVDADIARQKEQLKQEGLLE